jgi:hypothetical protein
MSITAGASALGKPYVSLHQNRLAPKRRETATELGQPRPQIDFSTRRTGNRMILGKLTRHHRNPNSQSRCAFEYRPLDRAMSGNARKHRDSRGGSMYG